MNPVSPPRKVFISYAHEDETLRDRLVDGLGQLQRQGLIDIWHDRRILAGDDWAGDIDRHLAEADFILLLLSPDFLASGYCYEKEMALALQRHATRQARVIPIVLRSCDWQNSPLKDFQALPKSARPVVDWKDRDKAFLDVAQGLRRLIESEPAEQPFPGPIRKDLPARIRRALRRWWWLGGVAAACVLAGLWSWSSANRFIRDGNALLDIGHYEDARAPFERARTRNPASRAARLGLEIVDLASLLDRPILFEQRLKAMQSAAGREPHLAVLEGAYYFALQEFDKAEAAYREATRRDPNLAEAWFGLGFLYDLQEQSAKSVEMYLKAVEHARLNPKYVSNLADQYFQRGEYEQARVQYEQISTFPVAALECARIYLLTDRLDQAAAVQARAIKALEDPATAASPEYGAPWRFKLGRDRGVRVVSPNEKRCFARLSHAATSFLRGDAASAARTVSAAAPTCGDESAEIKTLLRFDLERLAAEKPAHTRRAAEFAQKYLAP